MRKILTPGSLCLAMVTCLSLTSQGGVFNVNSTATLIGAINSANAAASPHTINLAPGTYTLTAELPILAAGKTFTIQGLTANPADTVIRQQTAGARILETFFNGGPNNVILTVNNLTFDNGQAGQFGGGALLVGGIGSATTVNNCVFSNNKATTTGGGGAISSSPNGDLTVAGCRFTGNTSAIYSGAIDYLNQSGGSGNLVVKESVFLNNTAAADGGAIRASAHAGTITILYCNFEGNRTTTAGANGGRGGAISHTEGNMVANDNRFFNNTAGTHANGDTLFQPNGATVGSCDMTKNWWGANTGPSATDLNNLTPVTTSPWLQLRNIPDATVLSSGGSTTLRADVLGLSTGGAIAAANLATLPPIPNAPATIFNNLTPALGNLSAPSSQFGAGKATATFTAGSSKGIANVKATLDNQSVTANISLPASVSSIARVSATPSNLGTVQWTVTFDSAVSGVAAGNFTLVNTGLGGSPAITTVTASGGAPSTAWTVSALTGSGSGTLGLNMTGSSGVSAPVGNLSFTGEVYTIDLVAPTTTLTATPPASTTSDAGSFSFTGADVGSGLAGFEFSLDGSAFSPAASPKNFNGLNIGSHTFQVRAIDGVGNVDASPDSFTWTIVNHPPVAGTVTIQRYPTESVKLKVAVLLAAVTDDDGDIITLTGVQSPTPGGGSVVQKGDNLIYTPAPSFTSADSFAYSVKDTRGGTATGTVQVNVFADTSPAQNILTIQNLGGGKFQISFLGIPQRIYTIQYTGSLIEPWQTLGTAQADDSGLVVYTDTFGTTSRLYRTVYP